MQSTPFLIFPDRQNSSPMRHGRLDRIRALSESGQTGSLEASASFQVGVLVCLGLWRERSRRGPQVDQGLHWLELCGSQQVESCGSQHKVAEAAIQLLLEVQVVKGLGKVCPVKMGVDPEHLQEDGLADGEELFGKSAPLPNPLVRAVEESCGGNMKVVCKRNLGCLSRKHLGVVDLARDPSLHERDVLEGRKLNGLKFAIQPRIGVVPVDVS